MSFQKVLSVSSLFEQSWKLVHVFVSFGYLVSNPSVVCGIKWTNTQSQTIHTKFHVHPNVLESPLFAGSIIHDFW